MHVYRTSAPALEMLADWSPTYSSQADFSSGLDLETGTVRVMGAGMWQPLDAQRYYQQQRAIVEEARRRFGPLKVLFDVREWIVEGPKCAEQFQEWNRKIFRPGDRLAAVVKSSLYKPRDCQDFRVWAGG